MLFARRFVRPRLAFFSSSRKKVDNAGEIVALRSLLKQWSDAYYNSSAPLVTDEQFDALRERLLALDPRAVDFVGASPTALGAPRHKHATPMLSLQSTRQLEELDDFRDSTIRFLETTSELVWATEFKYDGMALALHYDEKGKLVRAVTRGDGEVGEEVPLDRLIGASLPARIDTSVLDEACEVRGEVVLSRCQFDAVSEELGYKSARNAVVGIIRNEKPPDKRLQLAFVAYGVESAKVRNADYHVRVGLLKQLGFSPCAHLFVHTSWNSVIKEVKRGIDLRGKLDFETDGIVIKLNSRTQSDSLGSTRHHPKHSIAFKWSSLHLPVTSIKDIEWQVDQRGCLRPVALVVPAVVCDDGATISRASLHNWSFVERHRLQPGVPVQMERAGGTVPHLIPLPVSSSSPPVSPPSHCPCPVRAAVVSDPPLHLKCSRAAACPERIAYCAFAVASVFGVKGLGLISARQMSHAGLLSKDNPWAVMSLSQEQLESIGQGWGPKKGAKLAQEIDDRVRAATYEQILASLCVSGIGASTWKVLGESFGSLELLAAASEEQLAAVPGVGALSSASIHRRVNLSSLPKLLAQLRAARLPVAAAAEQQQQQQEKRLSCRGMQVVLTGTMTVPRSHMSHQIRSLGGSVLAAVSGKTTVLVIGKNPTQEKVDKAARLAVPLEDEAEFRKRLQ